MKYNTMLRPFFKNVFVVLQCSPAHWDGRLVGRFFQVPYSTSNDKNAFANIADPDQTILHKHSSMGQHYLLSYRQF